jgi:hypothetical protein
MSGESLFFVTLAFGAIAIMIGVGLANRAEGRRIEAGPTPPAAKVRHESPPRGERPRKAPRDGTGKPVAALSAPPRPFRIVFGAPDTLDVTIERCPFEFVGRLVEIPAHVDLTARLSSLLQYAPRLDAARDGTAAQDLYLLTLSPTAAQGLGSGTYDLAPAAEAGFQFFVTDEDGVVACDTLPADASLRPRGLELAFWQILFLMVGQPHLASADKRLKRLAHEVAEIRPFLDGRRWSRFSDRVVALEQVLTALHPYARNRPRSADDVVALRGQLESVERETQADHEAIRAEIVALVRGALGAGLVGFLGPDNDVTTAANRADRCALPLRQRNLAFMVRGVAAQLLACLPGQQELAQRFVGRIVDEAVRESRLADSGNAFLRLIDKKIENEARARLNAADHERLQGRVQAARRSLSEQRGALIEALEDLDHALEAQLEAQQNALVLVAQLDRGGRVRRLYRPS